MRTICINGEIFLKCSQIVFVSMKKACWTQNRKWAPFKWGTLTRKVRSHHEDGDRGPKESVEVFAVTNTWGIGGVDLGTLALLLCLRMHAELTPKQEHAQYAANTTYAYSHAVSSFPFFFSLQGGNPVLSPRYVLYSIVYGPSVHSAHILTHCKPGWLYIRMILSYCMPAREGYNAYYRRHFLNMETMQDRHQSSLNEDSVLHMSVCDIADPHSHKRRRRWRLSFTQSWFFFPSIRLIFTWNTVTIAQRRESKFLRSHFLVPSSSWVQNLHPNKFMPRILQVERREEKWRNEGSDRQKVIQGRACRLKQI